MLLIDYFPGTPSSLICPLSTASASAIISSTNTSIIFSSTSASDSSSPPLLPESSPHPQFTSPLGNSLISLFSTTASSSSNASFEITTFSIVNLSSTPLHLPPTQPPQRCSSSMIPSAVSPFISIIYFPTGGIMLDNIIVLFSLLATTCSLVVAMMTY